VCLLLLLKLCPRAGLYSVVGPLCFCLSKARHCFLLACMPYLSSAESLSAEPSCWCPERSCSQIKLVNPDSSHVSACPAALSTAAAAAAAAVFYCCQSMRQMRSLRHS
jgi:hypothetical protein